MRFAYINASTSSNPRNKQHSGAEMRLCVCSCQRSALWIEDVRCPIYSVGQRSGSETSDQDSMPCTSLNSHELPSSTHPSGLQMFHDAVLAFSPSRHELLWSGDDPSICFYHTQDVRFSHRLRQTLCHRYRCVHPMDRVGQVLRRLRLPPPFDCHKHCRSDVSSTPSQRSWQCVPAACRKRCDKLCTTRSS